MRRTKGKTRLVLRQRLEGRREEIEEAALARVYAIADPGEAPDPAYLEGLKASVSIALEYALEILQSSPERPPPVPVSLLAQARLAARNGVTLDAVLRRYFAGYSLLGYFLIEEASKEGLMSGTDLQKLVGTQAGLFDRFLKEIGEEHEREWEARRAAVRERQAERIERLLAGEPVDTSDVSYDFDGWHLGVVASGVGAEEAVQYVAGMRDCRLLRLPRERDVLWAWLGTRSSPDALDLELIGSEAVLDGVCLALGEPGEGLAGWRLTHRQAVAALPVAQRGPGSVVRYAEVALLAAVLRDEFLASSLRRYYLDPLDEERDGGAVLRETLRTYLAVGGSTSSSATALGVSRRTITNRLQKVEKRIGQSLHSAHAEIETALWLEEIATLGSRKGRSDSD